MNRKVIFVQGLPGSGKTTISSLLKSKLEAVHINADWARATITSHLGFSEEDRIKQAKSLAATARMIYEQGHWVIVDFVCPTENTRSAFFDVFKNKENVFSVWMDTIDSGRFEDTNKIYRQPAEYDYKVFGFKTENELIIEANKIVSLATEGHRDFFIRYNTHSDGLTKQWRIIDEETREETLVDDFELRGHMVPGATIEHDVTKWNVLVRGYGQFIDNRFVLTY